MKDEILPLFEELIAQQESALLTLARQLMPQATYEDILQPQDCPALENNPHFRYEEGILAGLRSAQAACAYKLRLSTGQKMT